MRSGNHLSASGCARSPTMTPMTRPLNLATVVVVAAPSMSPPNYAKKKSPLFNVNLNKYIFPSTCTKLVYSVHGGKLPLCSRLVALSCQFYDICIFLFGAVEYFRSIRTTLPRHHPTHPTAEYNDSKVFAIFSFASLPFFFSTWKLTWFAIFCTSNGMVQKRARQQKRTLTFWVSYLWASTTRASAKCENRHTHAYTHSQRMTKRLYLRKNVRTINACKINF